MTNQPTTMPATTGGVRKPPFWLPVDLPEFSNFRQTAKTTTPPTADEAEATDKAPAPTGPWHVEHLYD